MAPKYISSRPSASVTVVLRTRGSSSWVIGSRGPALRSNLAQPGAPLTADYRVVARDGRVGGVVRHQPDASIHLPIGLDRALNLIPIEQRGHDVIVPGPIEQLAHHHPVSGEDPGPGHGIADDLKDEQSLFRAD